MGRPLSGKTAPQGRMSLIDRVAGGSYTPPAPQPLAMPRQLENVGAPEKNNEVKPAAEAVAAPKKVVEKPVKKPAEKKTIVSYLLGLVRKLKIIIKQLQHSYRF